MEFAMKQCWADQNVDRGWKFFSDSEQMSGKRGGSAVRVVLAVSGVVERGDDAGGSVTVAEPVPLVSAPGRRHVDVGAGKTDDEFPKIRWAIGDLGLHGYMSRCSEP